jgi:hypothetical protein
MGRLCKTLIASLLTVGLASSALAEERSPVPNAMGTLTGKERLGKKWMDEQRIDNCNVPPDKRGTRPRPATCTHVPTG